MSPKKLTLADVIEHMNMRFDGLHQEIYGVRHDLIRLEKKVDRNTKAIERNANLIASLKGSILRFTDWKSKTNKRLDRLEKWKRKTAVPA